MNFKELNDIFFKYEKREDLFSKKIKGVFFWEIVRFELNRRLLVEKGFINNVNQEKLSIKDGVIKIFHILKKITFKNLFYTKKNKIYIFGHSRRQKINGKYTDIYSDFIKQDIQDYQDFEGFYWEENKDKSKESRNILYYDFIELLPFLLPKILFLSKDEKKYIKELEKSINNTFKVNLNISKIIINNLFRYIVYYETIYLFLKNKKPKKIIELVGYNIFIKALNKAAKELNIPTTELQHGVIDEFHLGYSMGKQKEIKANYFPDYIFTWGEYWNTVCNYPKNTKLISTGFPYFEINKSKYNTNKQQEKNIVVISQGAIGEDLSKKVYKVAKELKNYTFYYKLHPGEFHKIDNGFSFLKELKNIKIITLEKTVYDLFEICSIQIGVFSTAIYEGLGFGLKTIIFDLPGAEYLDDLVEKDIVKKIGNSNDCIDIIKNNDLGDSDIFDLKAFFMPNSISNFLKKIEEIRN